MVKAARIKDTVLGGEVLSTVVNRFSDNNRCDAILIMPTTHVTTREMIETARTCFGVNSADVLATPKLVSNVIKGSPTIINGIKLAVESHQVEHIMIFRHQGLDDGKIFFNQDFRTDEDAARIHGLVKAREHIIKLHPGIKVTMVYGRFPERGRFIQLNEILPDLTERTRMQANNRFMSASGEEIACDATIITCMDHRQFREVRTCVRDVFKVDRFGIIGLPGSGKRFLEDGNVSWQGFDLVSEKHGSNRFFIFHHGDCGAYGGVGAFGGDIILEEVMHREQMLKLRDKIMKRKPGAIVELVYARFIENGRRIMFVKFD